MEKVTAILYLSRMKLEKNTVKVYGRSNEEFYEQVCLAYRAKRVVGVGASITKKRYGCTLYWTRSGMRLKEIVKMYHSSMKIGNNTARVY